MITLRETHDVYLAAMVRLTMVNGNELEEYAKVSKTETSCRDSCSQVTYKMVFLNVFGKFSVKRQRRSTILVTL